MSEKTQTTNANKKIEIEAEYIIPLEELAFTVLEKKNNPSEIITLLRHRTKKVSNAVKASIGKVLSESFPEVKMKNLRFAYIDSGNITHGCAFFKAKLLGTEQALREVTDKEKIFVHDWEEKNYQAAERPTCHQSD